MQDSSYRRFSAVRQRIAGALHKMESLPDKPGSREAWFGAAIFHFPETSAMKRKVKFSILLLLGALSFGAVAGEPAQPGPAASRPLAAAAPATPKLDYSGHKRLGKASFYGKQFAGKKMADGKRMDPQADNAASRTLPLGTRAKVTNLETGQSAAISIQDRGPYVKGRIVDLSPSTARQIGIDRKKGVARVEVAPLAVPQPDGSVSVIRENGRGERGQGESRRAG